MVSLRGVAAGFGQGFQQAKGRRQAEALEREKLGIERDKLSQQATKDLIERTKVDVDDAVETVGIITSKLAAIKDPAARARLENTRTTAANAARQGASLINQLTGTTAISSVNTETRLAEGMIEPTPEELGIADAEKEVGAAAAAAARLVELDEQNTPEAIQESAILERKLLGPEGERIRATIYRQVLESGVPAEGTNERVLWDRYGREARGALEVIVDLMREQQGGLSDEQAAESLAELSTEQVELLKNAMKALEDPRASEGNTREQIRLKLISLGIDPRLAGL